ncbi:MAG: formylglycine-generating enzyme family protein, partial [Chlorobiaceae bacterium]|nr:formylglycine-generating enzyme family protein [Chlorobiaceae bacterium]
VGRYPDGATPEGLYDMAGNVWEWMGSRYSENTSAVSLRGGSWYNRSEILRCRARGYDSPGNLDSLFYGFRVVCPSPILSI